MVEEIKLRSLQEAISSKQDRLVYYDPVAKSFSIGGWDKLRDNLEIVFFISKNTLFRGGKLNYSHMMDYIKLIT